MLGAELQCRAHKLMYLVKERHQVRLIGAVHFLYITSPSEHLPSKKAHISFGHVLYDTQSMCHKTLLAP